MSEDMGRARLVAIEICQLFEEILDRHGIDIPSEDRDSEMEGMSAEDIAEAGFARLYGEEYYELEDAIAGIVENAMEVYVSREL